MHRTVIAVVDAARARLFTFDRSDEAGSLRESFSERTDLVNPAHVRTSANLDVIDADFAGAVAAAIALAVRDTAARRVVVCASPRMLGMLRTTDLRRSGIVIDELARDYSKMPPPQIHELLVDHDLLPSNARR